MMKYLLILLTLVMTLSMKGQTFLQGRIIDERSKPMAFANVVLLHHKDSTFVVGAVTKDDGTFTIMADCNNGLLKVSNVGYKIRYIDAPQGNVGDIQMQLDEKMLGEVTVKGHRPTHKLTAEGMLTCVEGTVLSKIGTGEDVLAHVPGIIKKQDSYEVFGKGTPIIYINGRQMREASELDQLKSDDIKSIELITTPGSKYDASVKAVVKIHTKAVKGEGFGYDVRSSYHQSENTDLVEQLNWNYRHNNLDIFGTLHYNLDNGHYSSTVSTLVQTDTIWQQKFTQDSKIKKQAWQNTIGANYLFDENNSAGFRYTLTLRPDEKVLNLLNSDITANDKYFDRIDNTIHGTDNYSPYHVLNVYYKGKIGKAGISFNTDYLYNKKIEHGIYDEHSASKDSRIVNTENVERNKLLAAKLVVDYPLLGGEFSVGAEYTHTKRNDDYINPEQYVPTLYAELQEQHISPFAEYIRQIPIGKVSVGLRYEWVDFDYYEDSRRLTEQSRSFGNLFPSFSFATQIGNVQMQLGYTAKTRRPTYQQLSNNVTYGNRFLLQSGNPLLNHEDIYDLSLMGGWKFLQFAIDYNDRRNAILYWAEQVKGNTAVTHIFYHNIPTLKNVSVQMTVAPTLGIWSPEFTASLEKQWFTLYTDIANYKMSDPILMFDFDNTLDLNHGWTVSADANVTFKGNEENCYNSRIAGALDVAVMKSLLNDRLSIKIQGSDLLHTQKQGTILYTGSMQSNQLNWYDSREFVLTLRYKFNTTRSKYKGTGAGNAEKERL